MKTKILFLNDNAYNNGYKSGIFFKKYIQKEIKKLEKVIDKETLLISNRNLNRLKEEYPEYYEEIKGKADGGKVNLEMYFALLSPELFNEIDHCTTIMCKKSNGKFIISHNEDDNYACNNFCISKVKIKDGWFATIDIPNMPFGNGFSWNSFGILKTINYCCEPKINNNNYSRYISQRYISEAKTIDELISRCEKLRPASGYHINAIDINNNIAVSIEVYPDSIDIQYIDDFYIHSNHYIHNKYKNKICTDKVSNSVFRLEKAHDLFNIITERNLENIKKILDYRDKNDKFEKSIFQTCKDPYITGLNISFDNENKNDINLYVYPNNEHLLIDYNFETIFLIKD